MGYARFVTYNYEPDRDTIVHFHLNVYILRNVLRQRKPNLNPACFPTKT